ncbi:MAG: ABC transporter permease [Planctomycetes bacterium]|nr:ABC transporter permease [Planctomycetota bacterium]
MRKIFIIAVREYEAAVKTKAFIISLVVMPVMAVGTGVVQYMLKDKVDVTDRRVAIVDHTGELYPSLAEAADERNTDRIYGGKTAADGMLELPGLPQELLALLQFDDDDGELRFAGRMSADQRDALLAAATEERDRGRIQELFEASQQQTRPKFLLERVATAGGSADDIRKQQKERVDRQEIFAFVEISPELLNDYQADQARQASDLPDQPLITYYTARTTFKAIRNWVGAEINEVLRQRRLAELSDDPAKIGWATARVPTRMRHIRSIDATGQHIAGEETNEVADMLIPFGLMYLMFMVIMVGATPLVQSVLEEKMQRIAEVLVASIPPFELMLGKLIGVVGVSLTITGVYLFGGYMAAHHYGLADHLPVPLLIWFFVFQALAIIMYGSLFIAIGAACSEMKEAQSTVMPVILLACVPMFVAINLIKEPTSAFAVGMSFFPPGTPMLMVLRMAAAPEIPLWQPIAGVAVTLATSLLCVWTAGRVFRVGILMQGKGAKFNEMLRWVVRG